MSDRTAKVVSVVCLGASAVFLGAALWVVVYGAPAGSDGLVRGSLAAYAGLAGVALGAVCGFFGGRRSARGELDAAHEAWAAHNAAPEREDLSLPPERTGDHPAVEMYVQSEEETLPGADWRRDFQRTFSLSVAERRAEPTQDDTGPGTVAHLRESGPRVAPDGRKSARDVRL